jgi:hypothetical protein
MRIQHYTYMIDLIKTSSQLIITLLFKLCTHLFYLFNSIVCFCGYSQLFWLDINYDQDRIWNITAMPD